jgi:hypothetical protein
LAPSPELFESGRNRRERRIQIGAEALHHGDDGHRDACRDETVFDRCRALVIGQKVLNKHSEHDWSSVLTTRFYVSNLSRRLTKSFELFGKCTRGLRKNACEFYRNSGAACGFARKSPPHRIKRAGNVGSATLPQRRLARRSGRSSA